MMSTTSDRTRQRKIKHLGEVIASAPLVCRDLHGVPYPYWLLDNGISVELPPEAEIKPGTTGMATYQGDPGVRVVRVDPWATVVLADEGDSPFVWLAPTSVSSWGTEEDVADFIPDVVLTRGMLLELHADGTIDGLSLPEWADRHDLDFL